MHQEVYSFCRHLTNLFLWILSVRWAIMAHFNEAETTLEKHTNIKDSGEDN